MIRILTIILTFLSSCLSGQIQISTEQNSGNENDEIFQDQEVVDETIISLNKQQHFVSIRLGFTTFNIDLLRHFLSKGLQ